MTRLFAGTPFDRPPVCERCGRGERQCECPPLPPAAPVYKSPEKQTARLTVEKRAKGKLMTVIRGLSAADNDLPALLTALKNACATGGALEGDLLLLQGDQRDRAQTCLSQRGYRLGK